MKMKRILAGWLFFLAVFLVAAPTGAREIKDMAGRQVTVPELVKKVYANAPPPSYLIYAIDPGLLAGLNAPIKEQQKPYLRNGVAELPLIGCAFGQGHTVNVETLLKIRPDVVVIWKWRQIESPENRKLERIMKNGGVPLVHVNLDHLADYPDALSFLGKLSGREERTSMLSRYGRNVLLEARKFVAGIPPGKRVKVYYAQGADGLTTECADSIHAELIVLAGGRNVCRCGQKSVGGMEKITLEQVMIYNPEVIITPEESFYRSVFNDSRWQRIKAVRENRVYLTPDAPFNWFDRPPSFMRFLGLKWLMSILYPNECSVNLVSATREFFKLFLSAEVSDEQINHILNR